MPLDRRQILTGAAAAGLAATSASPGLAAPKQSKKKRPRAITMWDFSWLERRWPGAGYEDWDQALDELADRGYDAVRIDAYPHLIADSPDKLWTLKPCWNTQDWGSPALNKVRVLPELLTFMQKCRARGIKVALSSWFREDIDNVRMKIKGPDDMARIWTVTLDAIKKAGLLDTVLWVDLCNEWPGPSWTPYVTPAFNWGQWDDPRALAYMKTAIGGVRKSYAELPLLFSTQGNRMDQFDKADISFTDLIEYHLWMAQLNNDEYYSKFGYSYDLFSPVGYEKMVEHAEAHYRSKPQYWKDKLINGIDQLAASARKAKQPLATTECWAVVDYKDWPLLNWDWIKELCALGTLRASTTGQWTAIATSNFCGPQFTGMWRDVAWHRSLTTAIKKGPISAELLGTKAVARL
jgi:Sugar-binding cellulase-like